MKFRCPGCGSRKRPNNFTLNFSEWSTGEITYECKDCGILSDTLDHFVFKVEDNIERVYRTRIDCMLVLAGGQLI